jgi:hypothetical protein
LQQRHSAGAKAVKSGQSRRVAAAGRRDAAGRGGHRSDTNSSLPSVVRMLDRFFVCPRRAHSAPPAPLAPPRRGAGAATGADTVEWGAGEEGAGCVPWWGWRRCRSPLSAPLQPHGGGVREGERGARPHSAHRRRPSVQHGAQRVLMVRGEGRGVSSQYGRAAWGVRSLPKIMPAYTSTRGSMKSVPRASRSTSAYSVHCEPRGV